MFKIHYYHKKIKNACYRILPVQVSVSAHGDAQVVVAQEDLRSVFGLSPSRWPSNMHISLHILPLLSKSLLLFHAALLHGVFLPGHEALNSPALSYPQ